MPPLKRHPALQPLSREHHQGLLLGQYLCKDVPDYKGYPITFMGRLKLTQQHFEDRWFQHFEREEKILIPAIRGIDAEVDALSKIIRTEHRNLTKLLEAAGEASRVEGRELLHQLGQLLVDHIRREERMWYERVQQRVPAKKFERLMLGP